MKPHLNQTIIQTYRQITAEYDRLGRLKAALEESGATAEPKSHPKAKAPKTNRKAPNGALVDAILSVFGKAGGESLNNGALRKALKASGYAYSLSPENVRQVLNKLKRDGKLSMEGEGITVRYKLAGA